LSDPLSGLVSDYRIAWFLVKKIVTALLVISRFAAQPLEKQRIFFYGLAVIKEANDENRACGAANRAEALWRVFGYLNRITKCSAARF
jgi:hypothetical protein